MKTCKKCGDEYKGLHPTKCDECITEFITCMEKIHEQQIMAEE